MRKIEISALEIRGYQVVNQREGGVIREETKKNWVTPQNIFVGDEELSTPVGAIKQYQQTTLLIIFGYVYFATSLFLFFQFLNSAPVPAAAPAHFSTALLDSSPRLPCSSHMWPLGRTWCFPPKCPHITAECVNHTVTSQEHLTSTNPAAHERPKATGYIPRNISLHAP